MKNNLRNNLLVIFTLFLIGFIVHFKSFQMVPYGDDWTFIYDYFAHGKKDLHINNSYPGLFAYLTPYGPAILMIGLVYQVFEKTYFVYYLIPLIFKILASFFLFLTLQNISRILKQNNRLINLLSAVLFLVGFTGIQSIDWSMNMNIYLALSIFTLGLFFQSKYYIDQKFLNLMISFFLFIFSIITAPTRFTPLIVILPLIDLVMVVNKSFNLFKILIFKNIILAIFIYIFLQIGIFGNPGEMNNTGLIRPFINSFLTDPILSFGLFMHWIGITILPVYPASNIRITALAGVLFLILLIWTFSKYRERWLVTGSILFFIPLFLMWLSSSLLIVEDSASRHLLIPFLGLCLLIGTLSMFAGKFKNIFKIIIVLIILMQIYSVNKVYSYWISIGRGYGFINGVQEQIMSHFPVPIRSPRIVYLDFDDGGVQQSVVFGLGYRIAVLSGTKNISLLPKLIADKPTLIKSIKEEMTRGIPSEKAIYSIAAFQYKNKKFSDVTSTIQEALREEIK